MNLLVVFLLALPLSINSHRILAIFPTPSYSHQIVFHPVMDRLAERGHELVVITPYPSKNTNITHIDMSALKDVWKKLNFAQMNDLNPMEFIYVFVDVMEAMMNIILEHPDVQDLLYGNHHFDAVICEALSYTPMYAFARHFNATLIGMTSLDLGDAEHAALGNVIHPTIHPSSVLTYHGRLTAIERVEAVYGYLALRFLIGPKFVNKMDTVIARHFVRTVGTSKELTRDLKFAIVSAHPALDNVRPIVPATIQVGFLHIKPPKPLSAEFLAILARPTIYMSFGSNVKSFNLKLDAVRNITNAFMEMQEFNIIWKWEGDTRFDDVPNLYLFKWLPQQDLLAHTNVKLFITQGGQQSMEEAIDREVPMITIPFFADQEVNAKKVEYLGIGRMLLQKDLGKLKEIIHNVLVDSKYKKAVSRLKEVVNDTPMPPIETAVWWIEYAIRHKGAPHLKYRGIDVPFWEYYLLDVILYTLLPITIIAVIICSCFTGPRRQ